MEYPITSRILTHCVPLIRDGVNYQFSLEITAKGPDKAALDIDNENMRKKAGSGE